MKELDTSGEIRRIKFVRDVPSQGTELSAFLDNCVQEGCGVQHRFPLGKVDDVQLVLRMLKEGFALLLISVPVFYVPLADVFVVKQRKRGNTAQFLPRLKK